MSSLYFFDSDQTWEVLNSKVERKICVYNDELMLVKVRFKKGGIGEFHQHPHSQISYVQSGIFHYTIGNETKKLQAGDSCIIPKNTLHGCECLEDGELIDSFTPYREDFL